MKQRASTPCRKGSSKMPVASSRPPQGEGVTFSSTGGLASGLVTVEHVDFVGSLEVKRASVQVSWREA